MPNLTTTGLHTPDRMWLGSAHGVHHALSGTLDVSTFDRATHFPHGYLPSGMPVGRRDSDGLWVLHDPAGTDGANNLEGFLLAEQTVLDANSRINAPILRHGVINLARLPTADVQAPPGPSSFVFIGATTPVPPPQPTSGFAADPFATSNFGGHA